MMARACRSCGGILGRDCFNEMECMAISNSQENWYKQQAEHAHVVATENAFELHVLEHRVTELESKIEHLLKLIHDNLGIVVTEKPVSEKDLPF